MILPETFCDVIVEAITSQKIKVKFLVKFLEASTINLFNIFIEDSIHVENVD